MYQFLIFLLAFVCVACNVKKPGENKKQPVQEMNGINGSAEFAFNEEIHNFGLLQSGEVVVFTFVFTNTGNEKLKVTNVKPIAVVFLLILRTKQPWVKPELLK